MKLQLLLDNGIPVSSIYLRGDGDHGGLQQLLHWQLIKDVAVKLKKNTNGYSSNHNETTLLYLIDVFKIVLF